MEKFEDLLISMGKIGTSKKGPVSKKEIKKTPIPKTLKLSPEEQNGLGRSIGEASSVIGTVNPALGYVGKSIGIKLERDSLEKVMLNKLRKGQGLKSIEKDLVRLSQLAGYSIKASKYEGIYVIKNPELRGRIIDKNNNLYLDRYDPEGWKRIENNQQYKDGLKRVIEEAEKRFLKTGEMTSGKNAIRTTVKFADRSEIDKQNTLEYALGESTILANVKFSIAEDKQGKHKLRVYIKYNLTDKFEKILGKDIPVEWGKPYDMLGPSGEKTILEEKFNKREDAFKYLKELKRELKSGMAR